MDMTDVYVGTYTETVYFSSGKILHGQGKGIYQLAFDPDHGRLKTVSVAEGVRNPSYLARSSSGGALYAVNEVKKTQDTSCGSVSAFAVDPASGKLSLINRQPTGGDDPCHVAVDAESRHVYVANYGSGSVCVFDVDDRGGLHPLEQFFQHEGSSLHPQRQTRAYTHAVILSPDQRFVYVPDLGTDQLVAYSREPRNGRLKPAPGISVDTPAGSGPRSGLFDAGGRYLYVINELSCSFTVYAHDALSGRLTPLQTVPSLLEAYEGDKTCADIHITPDGRFLYGTTRGANRIAVYALDPASGLMRAVDETDTGGDVPRNFAIDPSGRFLLIANQNSDNIVIFSIDPDSGRLKKESVFDLPSPVCLKLFPAALRRA